MILPWYLKGFVGANLLSLLTGVPNSCKPELWQKRMQGIKPYVAKIGSEIVAYADVQNGGRIDHFLYTLIIKVKASALSSCKLLYGP